MIRNVYFTKFQALLWCGMLIGGGGGEYGVNKIQEYLEYKKG